MDDGTAVVRLAGVVKRHARGSNAVTALRGVDLAVSAGEYLGVFGPSGSGKSTLLNVIAGIDVADAGTVQVLGHDLARSSDDARAVLRRRGIGVVYQSFHLIAALTVAENVALPLLLDGWPRRRADERVAALLAAVDLQDRGLHRPAQLSGGEMQRTAVARALAGDPKLVLADEPTGNLDTAHGAAVLTLLRALASERGRAVIVVTHDPRAADWCDRFVELRDGRLSAAAARDRLGGPGECRNGKEHVWASE